MEHGAWGMELRAKSVEQRIFIPKIMLFFAVPVFITGFMSFSLSFHLVRPPLSALRSHASRLTPHALRSYALTLSRFTLSRFTLFQ